MMRGKRALDGLDQDIRDHIEHVTQDNIDSGMAPEEARRQAMLKFGNVALAKEEARAVWVCRSLDEMRQDVPYAFRTLRRRPAFAVVAVGILATGIGLTSSVFAVFNAAALRPWAVPDAASVVNVYQRPSRAPRATGAAGFSIAEARFLDRNARGFLGIVAMSQADLRFEAEAAPRIANGMIVTGNYFRVLGVEMARGRGFTPEEDALQTPQPVTVLSHVSWRTRFGADPEIGVNTIRS